MTDQKPAETSIPEKWAPLYRIAAVPPVSSADEYLRMCIEDLAAAQAQIAALTAERDRLKGAILWANGQVDDFPERAPRQGAYWWRTELMRRAALDPREPS